MGATAALEAGTALTEDGIAALKAANDAYYRADTIWNIGAVSTGLAGVLGGFALILGDTWSNDSVTTVGLGLCGLCLFLLWRSCMFSRGNAFLGGLFCRPKANNPGCF